MAAARRDNVKYVPHPDPHPGFADAPRTGVPVNPLPTRTTVSTNPLPTREGVKATPMYPKNGGFPK
jgi:hypothetical protein